MQIYINKNGQQFGPLGENAVLQMLQNGQFSASDLGIRQGETQWRRLDNLFPNANSFVNNPVPPMNNQSLQPPKKSGLKVLLFVLAGFGVLLIFAVGGIFYFVRSERERKRANAEDFQPKTESNVNKAGNSNGKNPAYYKTFADKSVELGNLKPSLKLNNAAKIKGKVAVLEKTRGDFS